MIVKSKHFAMGAILSSLIGMTVAVAPTSAALAAPSDTPSTGSTYEQAPGPNPAIGPDVPRKIAEYKVDYKEVGGTKSKSARAASFPSGCGLTVILYRNGNTLHSSVMTKCAFTVSVIENNATLSRSRWFGWENVQTHPVDHHTQVATVITEMDYNCTNTGTHDFKLIGSGNLTKGGTHYYADAYDELDKVSCD